MQASNVGRRGVPWYGGGENHHCSHPVSQNRVAPPQRGEAGELKPGDMENGLAELSASAQHHRVIEKEEQGMTPALKEPHILGDETQTQSPGVPRLEIALSPLFKKASAQVRTTILWNACLCLQLVTEAAYRDPGSPLWVTSTPGSIQDGELCGK